MRNVLFAAAGAFVALALAFAAWLFLVPTPEYRSPAMLNAAGADIGGPFELTAHSGERLTSASLIDRPTLLYFGYTYCPDICPIDTQTMVDAVEILDKKGVDVLPVFVTVDPGRDTPDELSDYVDAMHPKLIALTGSEADIRVAADAYKVFYNKVELGDSAAGYLMEHTGYTYLAVGEDKVVAIFRNGFPPEQIAADIEHVLSKL